MGYRHGSTDCNKDDSERLSFLRDLTKKVNKPSSQDAYVYALVAAAEVKLRLHDLSSARKDLDTAESILDNFDSVETEVHATFYRINASYYQVSLMMHLPKHQFLTITGQRRFWRLLQECPPLPRLHRPLYTDSDRRPISRI